jgi:hypothetical protein
MKLTITIDEKELRALVMAHLRYQLGEAGAALTEKDVRIEVKSAQNYKSEWERAEYRAVMEKSL